MPPLQLFGRNWHISSDDLALPACIGVAFHGTWASLLAAEVVMIGLPDDCEGRQLASSSVLWLLVSFSLTTLLQCVVAGVSMRGAMLEEYKRAAMPSALYCLLSAYTLEAAALVYATIVNFGVLRDTLSTCHTAEELARTSISELSLHRWFIGTTWAMLLVISSLLWLMYNLYPDRGLESWEKRVNCMSYILCCRKSLTADPDSDGAQSSSAPTVVRLARVFGDLFYPLDFSFTDIVAAITLVGITHRSSAHGHGSSSHNHALIAAAGAGVLSPAKHDAPSGAGALLEAAVAYAATPNGAAKPAVITAQHAGEAAQSADAEPTQLAGGSANPAAVDSFPAAGAGVAGGNHAADCVQQAQELQLAERATSSPCLAAAGDGGASATSGAQRCPSPGLLGIRHSSSTGNMQAAGLARGAGQALAEPSSTSFTRSASSSAWEAAVRQGSTLAVAPGHGFLPAPAAAGVNLAGNRAGSSVASEPAIPTRSHSTAADGAAAAALPPRFSNRAVSWGGTTAVFHPSTGQSPEPGLTQPLLQSLAESNELSLAGGIEQVQSLLSPVQSARAASEGPVASGVQQLGVPPAGDAFGTAGAAVASSAAARDAAITDAAAVFANPLYSSVVVPQPDTATATAAGQVVRRTPGSAPAAAGSSAANALVAAAAAAVEEEGVLEEMGGAVTSTGQPVPLELLEEALHWHAYANAIYGWPMFLWSHRYRVLRCCRLCCGGCCKGVPHSTRSSAGGLSMHNHALSASTDEALAGKAVSKPGSFNNSISGPLNSSTNGTGPVTAVVTMSSVDTDSVSPGSTTAGAAAVDGSSLNGVRPSNGPLGEGVESRTGSPRQQQQGPDAATACVWDVEQGGGVCSQQAGTAALTPNPARTAAAAEAGTDSSGAVHAGAPAGAGRSSGSRRWVQSSGNVWLLQGLADVLGITREPAAAANAGGKSPRGSARGSGGGGPGRTSVASGLGDDQGPCGCLCGGKWGASHVPKMAPLSASQRLTNEAIMQTANIPAADLLYVNYNNLVEGLLPYSVALDAARRCVVVAIRGSLSVEDCVTDILYDPAPLDGDWLLQQPSAAAAADPCSPITWPQHPSTAAALAAYEDPAAAQQHVATEEALRQLQQQLQQQQQQQQAADWEAADAAQQSSPGLGLPTPSRSMIGASSGGGSFRSVKASPFASAAAAASIAASHASSSAQQPPLPPLPPQQQSPQQQPQPSSGLVRMPSVPAAQAAAAAAAAASQPLAAGGRPLKRLWSVNFTGLQQQDQQQQVASPKLSEQPSFMRRAAGTLRPHTRQQQCQSQDEEQQRPQQQQLTQRPSVLDTALSLLRGPWRRSSNASETGEGRRRRTSTRESDAAVAAEEGRARGLGNLIHRRRTGSIEHSSIHEAGSSSPRRLFKTFSLNLGAGRGGAGQQQQQQGVRRRTTSSRMMNVGREHLLQSCASEHIPTAGSPRRSTAESWRQSQMHRTTAADRALGAARAGHRYAPMTSPATDQSAAAAAARDRSYMQHLHQQQHLQQQQQQLQQQLSTMPSMRSTAPASTHSPAAAGADAGASPGTASEPGRALQHDVMQHDVMPSGSPTTSAVGSRLGSSAGASPRSGYSSRRATFTQLPRINSGGAAAGGGPEQQQQQPQLSMMASMPVPPLALQQQQQQAAARARRASDEGSSVGGSSSAAGQRPSLQASVSDMALRARRLGMLLSMSRAQAHPQQQQQQQGTPHLSDGGPTDFSLLAGAATMVPSRTAAVPPAAAEAAPSSGAGSFLRTSFSARPAPVGSFAGLSTSHSLSTRPPGTPSSLAGHSVGGQSVEGFATGLAGGSAAGATTAGHTAAAAAAAAAGGEVSSASDVDVSPFMLLQQPAVDSALGADASAAAAAHVMGGGLLPAVPSTQQELWGVQQQQQQSLMEACMDGSPAAATAAAVAAAEEAAFAEEQEAAAAAEADAVAAAAQAAAAEQTPDTGAAGAQWFAHEGILNCARAIRDDLDRLGLLDQLLLGTHQPPAAAAAAAAHRAYSTEHQDSSSKSGAAGYPATACCAAAAAEGAGAAGGMGVAGAGAVKAGAGGAEEGRFMSSTEMPDCRGWTLVLTGHSLGAGVAALLGLHYRARYASVRCWCFAPPGGLMSPAAASSLKDICYSLVSAKDMIPRMSLWTIERLRDEMMICALRCKMPKYKLLLGAALGKKWSEEEVLRPLEELSDAEVRAFQDYRRAVVEERSLDPLRVRIAREFVPPGEVLWLERNKMLQPRLRVVNTLSTRPGPATAPDAAQHTSTAAAAGVLDSASNDAPVGSACVAGHSAVAASGPAAAAAAATAAAAHVQARGTVASSSPVARSADTTPATPGPPAPTPAAAAAPPPPPAAAAPGSAKSYGGNSMLRGGSAALEAAAVAVAGKRVVSRLQPRITDGLGIIVGGMVVSRNMFADHVPDKQLYQLKRLVRYLKRQQALGRPLPPGIEPVLLKSPPAVQQGMSRRLQ